MTFNFGRGVREVLRPQFFTELQGRYGNMFNVSERQTCCWCCYCCCHGSGRLGRVVVCVVMGAMVMVGTVQGGVVM